MKTLILAAAMLASGCATITNGTEQTLQFDTQPGQVCNITRSGEALGTVGADSPTITVQRSSAPLNVECEDSVQIIESSINAAGYTSIMWLDFGLVDFITGALWEYKL